MAQAIVNLALPVIECKVEEILDSYPVSPHQQAFSSIALREKLVTYVLRRMPTLYTTTEMARACSVEMPANCFSNEQTSQMDHLIHQGIQHLLTQQHMWETAAPASSFVAGTSPSHWFG